MQRVYLDYAAATPIDGKVITAMRKAEACFANPSAQYASARAAKTLLNTARRDVAMFLGANQDEIIFTSGATEANNLAILGAARAVGRGRIISLNTEHASVREPIQQLEKEGFSVDWCGVGNDGVVDRQALNQLLQKDTILVSIAFANSEIGTIQSLAKIVADIRAFEKNHSSKIIIHTDASAATLLNCDVSRLGVDLLSLNAAKMYGPKGAGALYVRRGTQLVPTIFGGGQENSVRAGSENVVAIVGFAAAVRLAGQNRKTDEKLFSELYTAFLLELKKTKAKFVVTGNDKQRLFSIASFVFEGINGEDLVAHLDAWGFEVATGAACEAANEKPSQSLLALGFSPDQAQGSLRVSFGRQTTKADIKRFTKALAETLTLLESQKS